jgi:antitoxin VapB
MPLYIKDDETARLVAALAKQRGVSKQAAVRMAVALELAKTVPLGKRFAELRRRYPLPPATGKKAGKAFFDALSGQ